MVRDLIGEVTADRSSMRRFRYPPDGRQCHGGTETAKESNSVR